MLPSISHQFTHPDDIPGIPQAASEFLQARLNHSYLSRIGALDDLRKAGFSESAVLGFIEGAAAAVELIELMEEAQKQGRESSQEGNFIS